MFYFYFFIRFCHFLSQRTLNILPRPQPPSTKWVVLVAANHCLYHHWLLQLYHILTNWPLSSPFILTFIFLFLHLSLNFRVLQAKNIIATMTNLEYGLNDSSLYYDNKNINSLNINGDLHHQIVMSNGITKSSSNSISVIAFNNQEKPPYCSTLKDHNESLTRRQSSSIIHLLHLISVVVASATINGVVFGVVNNFGVFYVYLIELFRTDSILLILTPTEEQFTTVESLSVSDNITATTNTMLQPLIGKWTLPLLIDDLNLTCFCYIKLLLLFGIT